MCAARSVGAAESLTSAADGYWVTVFGFAPEALPQMLRAMQPSSSAIVSHVLGSGNWAHLRYARRRTARPPERLPPLTRAPRRTRSARAPPRAARSLASQLEVAEACAKNGSLLGASLLGVLPGIHPRPDSAPDDSGAASGALGEGLPLRQTAWLKPTQPPLDWASLARAPLVAQGAAMAAPLAAASGLGGLLLRIAEYLFGW